MMRSILRALSRWMGRRGERTLRWHIETDNGEPYFVVDEDANIRFTISPTYTFPGDMASRKLRADDLQALVNVLDELLPLMQDAPGTLGSEELWLRVQQAEEAL